MRELVGQYIRFDHAKHGDMKCKLLGFSEQVIQVEILTDWICGARTYFKGDRRLFNREHITELHHYIGDLPRTKREAPEPKKLRPRKKVLGGWIKREKDRIANKNPFI
jgi:hypothetical protein